MEIVIEAACGCDTGRVRKNNEDNFYFGGRMLPRNNNGLRMVYTHKLKSDEMPLLAVFDGMGGEESGEVASFLAADMADRCAEQLKKYCIAPRDFFEDMCTRMNRAVCEESQKLAFGRMGSTVAALLFVSDTAYVCNLGDSRVYRLRDNELMQISVDHTELQPSNVTRKPRLMQHLGIFEDELRLEPYIAKGTVEKDDRYLICSDGLTDMLSNVEICSIIKAHKSVKQATAKLIERALKNGGKDNVTVILCRVK